MTTELPDFSTTHMVRGMKRIRLRHKIVAAMLLHRAEGVWGRCSCGARTSDTTLPGHIRDQIAAIAGIDRTVVDQAMEQHRALVGRFGGEMRCDCGEMVIDRDYGIDIHKARAMALLALPEPGATRAAELRGESR